MSYNGKAIYNPSGKAGEYSYWACNFYVGCSNGCEYCYCKKGILANTMGQDKPQLKKCFNDEDHALDVFEQELNANLTELKKYGIFFSFTTDPMILETAKLTALAVRKCMMYNVPVKILTKSTKFIRFTNWFLDYLPPLCSHSKQLVAFGFTLTGHDELERGASTNAERIEAMRKLDKAGFKTFASIEPIVDLGSSLEMICATTGICDLYKIGLMSGSRIDRNQLQLFIEQVIDQVSFYGAKLYFKDSLLKAADIERSELPAICVGRDYNIFKVEEATL